MTWGQGSTRATRKVATEVLHRDNHQCRLQLPGCTTQATEAHHLNGLQGQPRAQATNPDQMIAVCRPCHRLVTEQQRMAAWRADQEHRRARRHLPARPHPGE